MRITASQRSSLIRLASELPTGSKERRAILSGLKSSSTEKEANPAVMRAILTTCASSSTCRKITSKALRLPDALHKQLARYAGAAGTAALEKAGMAPEHVEFVAKLAGVALLLGRIPQAPMLLLADIIEGMSDTEAEAINLLM